MACPDCFRGGKAVGEPKGSITTLHGVETYIAGGPEANKSDSTIIFYTDAFGLLLVNNKLLADAYALATGCRVLVPEIIPGGPMSPDLMPLMDVALDPVAWLDFWGQVNRATAFVKAVALAAPFFWRAWPSAPSSFAPCLKYAREVRASLPPGAKLGAAGFCWGGYQSLGVCAHPAVEGSSEPLIDAQFCAHPSGLKLPDNIVDAVMNYKTKVSIAHSTQDIAIANKDMMKTEAELRQKTGSGDGENGFHWEIKYFDGVRHGFAVRAKPGSQAESDASDVAKEQAIEWFKRWL